MSHAASRPRPAADPSPSAGPLAFGLNVAGDAVVALLLLFFVVDLFAGYLYQPVLSVAAWVVLIAVIALTQLGLARRVTLPAQWFTIAMVAFGAVTVLDVFGVFDRVADHVWGPFPMALIGIGCGLLPFATTTRSRTLYIATTVLAVLLLADVALTADSFSVQFASSLIVLAIAVLPPLVGVSTVAAFNQMVQFQSDLSQAKGTTSASGASLGLSASEQLVRLDAQAERLLDDVAGGRTPLPLPETVAEEAAIIAAQLRLGLVAGKSETWLYHALTESSVLGPISTIDDPEGNSAQLAPDQRDGLLTAIWMLAGDGARMAQSLAVTVRRASGAGAQTQRLAITIELIGVPKRRVDPAAWQAITRVGRYSQHVETPTLRIDIDCALDVVADR